MDKRKKDIYIELAFTIFFLLLFIVAYFVLFVNSVPVTSSLVLFQSLSFIPAILLLFSVFFFFTLLNQIFSNE